MSGSARRVLEILPSALGLAAAVGAAAGAIAGGHYLAAGYPLLWLGSVLREVHGALLAVVIFLPLFAAARRLATPRLPAAVATPLAAALAGAPVAAWLGFRLNRAWGIRPSAILEPYALKRNLALLTVCFAVYVLVCLGLRRRLAAGGPARWWLAATLAGTLLMLDGGLWLAFRAADDDPPRPDVLILLVDALRADHLSSYGHHRETPAIDSLAADGVLFRQAISQSTFTKSSIASLFTGRYPYQHGLYWGSHRENPESITSDVLRREEITLAEALRSRGYLTAAWVQNSHLRDFMGFDQGFVSYRDSQGSIARIHRAFRGWLRGPLARYPTFAYLHYIDLHDPYRPEPPYDTLYAAPRDVYAGIDLRRWGAYLQAVRQGRETISPDDLEQLRALYDGQLRLIDDEIGRLLDQLRAAGLYDRTLIVLTSDHGDGFLEHGFISHSTTPYEELIRVPLIIKLPEGRFRGREVSRQVRLIDVMPTVLEALGIDARRLDPRPRMAGCSLLPLLRGEALAPRCDTAVVEIAEDGAYPSLAIRTERFKYIHHAARDDELYDLLEDPGERTNLAAGGGEEAQRLGQLALDLVAQRPTGDGDRIELDEEQIRRLKAMGYID